MSVLSCALGSGCTASRLCGLHRRHPAGAFGLRLASEPPAGPLGCLFCLKHGTPRALHDPLGSPAQNIRDQFARLFNGSPLFCILIISIPPVYADPGMTAQSHGPSQNTSSHQQNSRVSTDALLVSLNGPSQGDAFGAALAQFKYTVPDAQLAEFKNITYDVLCKTIGQIQSDQDRRRQLMGFSRIARCLEALHQLGKVVEVFVNVSNVVAFIWGPMKFLLLVLPP